MVRTKVSLFVALFALVVAAALPQQAHAHSTKRVVATTDDAVTARTVAALAKQTLTELGNLEESAETLAVSVGMSVTWLNGTALFSTRTDTDSAATSSEGLRAITTLRRACSQWS